MKRNSFAALLILATLVLNACNGGKKRIPIRKDLKPGNGQTKGTHVDESLNEFAEAEDCLKLDGLTAALVKYDDAFLLYTYNIDLGKFNEGTFKNYTTHEDDVLRGQTIKLSSLKLQSKRKKVLTDAGTLSGLLAVQSQDACESVTFTDGTTWTMVDKAKGVMTLSNSATGEARKYSFSNKGEINVSIYTPTAQRNCKDEELHLYKREAVSIAWDGRLSDGLEIPGSFIAAIGKHVTLPKIFELQTVKEKGSDRVSTPQSLKLPQAQYELLKTIIDDSKFDKIDCN